MAKVMTEDGAPNRYSVQDLSVGGALLTGGPPLRVGASVRVMLTIAGAAPLSVRADVVRQTFSSGRGLALGIAFVGLAPREQDVIREVVVRALGATARHDGPLRVVVVADRKGPIGPALERQLFQLGHRVLRVGTASEAMSLVADPETPVDAVFLDHSTGLALGLGFLRHLARRHPLIRRVLVVGHHAKGRDPVDTDLADATLRFPWESSALCAVIGQGAGTRGGRSS